MTPCKPFRKAAALAAAFILCASAQAIELTKVDWRGHQALRLSGVIDDGSAAKFEPAIAAIDPAPHGARILLLDSPGGSVKEALLMSRIMESYPVHAVIPDGAACASSCASILFIGGKFRTVEDGGRLGQHSCAKAGVPNEECNDMLSENAVRHGVDYGAVSAFVTSVPPDKILWLSREDVDGYEISKYPGTDESNYLRVAPLIYEMLKHEKKPAQTAWRLDFREDGYRAFLRPAGDDVRQAQINLFCDDTMKGRMFLSWEVIAPAAKVQELAQSAAVEIDGASWTVDKPVIWQMDRHASEIVMEIPATRIQDLLTKASGIKVTIELPPGYQPMIVTTRLDGSRKVLAFAASHCVSGLFDGPRPPLD